MTKEERKREKELQALRKAGGDAQAAFADACPAHGFFDNWAYWRHVEAGGARVPALDALDAAATKAVHAFYSARDGDRGFLGGKGL